MSLSLVWRPWRSLKSQVDIMSTGENQDDRPSEQEEELGEETFLKVLYTYMKKRDTPIERIPHLGFKQIDLFMMYKTVKNLGGYHQVTAQQMWKQVYNTLGGNPRSTSAATCTRRHYEKLLLPYECHVSGGDYMDALPQRQQKRSHCSSLSDEDDCPRSAKCGLTSLHQNPNNFLTDSRVRIIPMPLHYRQYYQHPGFPIQASRPSYVQPPLTSSHPSSHPVPHAQSPYLPPSHGQEERDKQPLEHLRFLADRYNRTSGWNEPLNLSCKRSGLESGIHPASSFSPPPSNKSPKFLNTPSPLYPAKGLNKDDGCEKREGESPQGKHLYPAVTQDDYVIDLTSCSSGATSSSPASASDPCRQSESPILSPLQSLMPRSPSVVNDPKPLKREYTDWSSGVKNGESPKHSSGPLNLLSPPKDKGGRMEIQIPLALLHDLIKGGLLCGPAGSRPEELSLKSLTSPGQNQTTGSGAREREHSWSQNSATMVNHADQVLHSHPRNLNQASEDLREKSLERCKSLEGQKNLPSPTSSLLSLSNPMQPYQFSSFKPHPHQSIISNMGSQDLYRWNEQDDTRRPCQPKPIHLQDILDRAKSTPFNLHSNNQALNKEGVVPTSLGYSHNTSQGRVENPGMAQMMNPLTPSLGSLTPEEFIKLKRLISSSS
ncbi:hypothetical protein UPYG_G00280460 [Umbra pygmaea]|uniref:ARID domain-containing protein n=1 Tax=Umbra pygmaea TaxID=75934 RepID=A0ABD0W310_UMBPY